LLAKSAIERGRLDQARALLDGPTLGQVEQLIGRDPSRSDVMAMLGLMLMRVQRLDAAEHWFRKVLELGPDPMALQQVAELCRLTGRYTQATDLRRQAVALTPDDVEVRRTYAFDLMREGRFARGLGLLKEIVEANPDHAEARSQWLFQMNYLPRCDPRWLSEQYRQWGRRHMPRALGGPCHDRSPDPDRPLRVGFLSGDLRMHSVAYGLEPILEHLDPDRLHLYAYSSVPRPDRVTQRLKAHFRQYRDIGDLDDRAAADLIDADQVDILVVVASHTDYHRLGVVARKPAPIQVDYGGLTTLGLGQVDYRLSDEVLDPPGSQPLYVEELAYLPGGFVCYRPAEDAPAVTALPARARGFVTFGSFNNSMKIHPGLVRTWTQILKAVPYSRLLLKFAGGDEPRIQRRFLRRLAAAGVAGDRIEIVGWRSPEEYLEVYSRVDIGLDTHPFNGCVTTLEGLWMGVPTVTLTGDRTISRVGQDILRSVGLGGLVTRSAPEYVAKAAGLASDLPSLARIRNSLRQAMAASRLCDGRAHALAWEQTLRRMWRRWCETQNAERGTQNPGTTVPNGTRDVDRMEFFVSPTSDLKFTISKKGLPALLFEAASAVEAGEVARAVALLTDRVEDQVRRIPEDDPARPDAAFMLATLLSRTEQPDKAEPWYQEVLRTRPHALIYFELGNLARSRGQLSQALEYQRKAVEHSPDSDELRVVLADHLIKVGRNDEGIELLRRVVEQRPDAIHHSKYLWHLHQGQTLDRASIFEEHRRWGRLHAPRHLARAWHENEPDPDRRLRVGYLSPDFCGHSVAYFFESLLDGHDPRQVETFGYGNVACQDVVTDRLAGKFHRYCNIRRLADPEVVQLIEQDRIDVLVDLAGHTGDNRLTVMAHKPAPVQVSFLGYPDTTGMAQVDYRFTDRWADQADAQGFHTEQLVWLQSGFICYRPPGFAPAVGPLPALDKGFVTFGSFNNNGKINTHVLDLWAQVLREVPRSRVLLKFEGGDDGPVRQHYTDELSRRGISPDRIAIVGRRPVLEHWDLYNQVDIGLDTFPYHGTTTTCEALWMGVPSVTLVGKHHASRVGLSLLARTGLEAFAAATPAEYVAKAAAYAGELDNLAVIRQSVRHMMQASPLCDAKAHARDVEAAYRMMWRTWCGTGSQRPE
jgi:predicted O-linked N-acetylglucosamine transferase (SPINDLY family)